MTDEHRPGRSRNQLTRRTLLGGLVASTSIAVLPPAPSAAEEKGPAETPDAAQNVPVEAKRIAHFQRGRTDIKRFGDLEFRGGLVLTSPSEHFGGWSGLVVERDGRSLLAVSDAGAWLTADLTYDGASLTGIARSRIGPLLGPGGARLKNKREQDAESVALVEGNLTRGTVLIGFECAHRIGRFEIRDRELRAPAGFLKLPPEAMRMQPNQGIEALAVLQAGPLRGTVVAFAERFTRGSGYHTGWMWVRNEPQRIHLQDIDGFNITGAAGLPDGGLLVLERYFRWTSGVKMRLRRLAPAEIVPGARMTGRILLEVDASYEIDNMEGIAVHRGAQGETVVSLISDDNFNHLLQRTILLQFALVGE